MSDEPRSEHPSGESSEPREAGCGFQDATDLATRAARLGLEAAATPLSWLPGPARESLRHNAANALRGLAVGPRILSGILEEVAREVQVPLEESHLGSRREGEPRAEGGPREEEEPRGSTNTGEG
ncbi:hypothetical protein AN478_13395 [Thiohalorhabdus denitrificans]|uniref:hypothetical protein n=1 Tax=Thiohalorhabdus denitrificans TaxID=381306 RepID=UPI0006D5540B|nr:hypothetical protein [Thiohalorhabdus denitrificans]KPV39256.1 hypothetical protein AN478_13395 [Thiohalorhabdus denitrificans]